MHPNTRDALNRADRRLKLIAWDSYAHLVRKIVSDHTLAGGPFKKLLAYIEEDDWTSALNEADSLSAQVYADAASHFAANQIALLIKKHPFPKIARVEVDTKAVATEKFHSGEATCRVANEYFSSQFNTDSSEQYEFDLMRGLIRYALGDEPPLRSIWERCDFGPGANVGVHGDATNVARKIGSQWSVSPSCLNWAYAAVSNNWHLMSVLLDRNTSGISCLDTQVAWERFKSVTSLVDYNKIAFVPKTALTDRSIAVEPLLNSYVQKGIDLIMRERLLTRLGINLADQGINQKMAREGSLTDSDDSFVTIDLSNASNSISIGVVRELVPPEWYRLLDDVRSKSYHLAGATQRYEMFCSMGNGFCFPLETLLFTAACHASGAGRPGVDYHVYGDDIIVRKRVAGKLLRLLGRMGFSVNVRKTFLEGPFRESCGADWFNGEDVRPYTFDTPLVSIRDVFKWLNLTRRNERSKAFFEPYRQRVLDLVPAFFRFFRPRKGPEDTGIDAEDDEVLAALSRSTRWDRNYQCWSWLEFKSSPVNDREVTTLERYDFSYLYAMLRGHKPNSMFTIRRRVETTVVRVTTDTDRASLVRASTDFA